MLILTVGISTGLAFGLLHLPSVVIVGMWFDRKRGLATGIVVAGTGVGLFVLPPICQAMIDAWGWQCSMYGLAAIVPLSAPMCILYRDVPSSDRKPEKHHHAS